MMRLLRSASLLVAFFLLTSAAMAHAECAWVLWSEETMSSYSYRTADANVPGTKNYPEDTLSWVIIGAYPTNAACKSQEEWKIGDMLKRWRKEKAEAKFGQHSVTHEAGGNIISRRSEYVNENTSTFWKSIRNNCLPDTVDPRGPKGK